jgi:alpha-1,2-mannosyltransferase
VNASADDLKRVRLLLIGSCRNADDEKRVRDLEQLANELNVRDMVDIKVNFTFENMLKDLAESAVGMHSMIDEHFGIGKKTISNNFFWHHSLLKTHSLLGVVECMAAGTVMIAHNSAGPKMDIVVPYKGEKSGFLAETAEQYAEALYNIYTMNVKKRNLIREAAREHVKKFSQEKFNNDFIEAFNTLCFEKFISNKTKSE